MKIRTTVSVEITDERGERFLVEREAITQRGANPRFVAAEADTEVAAITGTVIEHLVHQFGGAQQLADRRKQEDRR